MDYASPSNVSYLRLLRKFSQIVEVLSDKLKQLHFQGYDPKDGYLFGFSFGAQVVLRAAINAYGYQQLAEIDGNYFVFLLLFSFGIFN
jgi:dienelactone hydrolase